MDELTKDMIQAFKKDYSAGEKQQNLASGYQTNTISKLAFRAADWKAPEFEFSTQVQTMGAVSQGNTGRCWIQAGLNLLREIAVRRMKGTFAPEKNVLFSAGYLMFWDKMEKANCFLEKAVQLRLESYEKREVCSWFQYGITEGGFWNYFANLVKKIWTCTFGSNAGNEFFNEYGRIKPLSELLYS